jgi:hypothetical protein
MIVAGSIVLGGTAQASVVTGQAGSSGQITSPSDGEVISSSSVMVSARTGLMQLRMGLYVDGPSTPSQKVAAGGANQTLSGTFDAGDAPNGTFTVTLKGEITGNRYASSTFKLRRPAEAPGGVNASRQGADKVLVTWSKGSEPDLQSYEVANTQSGVVGRLSADSACAGSSCKAVLAVPSKAAGQKVGFSVKAFRGDGDGGSIGSGESAAAYVTFPAPPAAQPTKKATDSVQVPKKNRDAQGVDALPTLPAKKQAAVPSRKPTTPTRKPTTPTRKPTTTKLPDIPDADPSGNLPIPTADQQAENGGLVPADTKDGTDEDPVQSDGVKAQSSESPIGNIGQYGIYVAGGILLLLLGAHAGAWARRRALATGASGSTLTPTPDTDAPPGSAQAQNAHPGLHVRHADAGTPHPTAAPRRPAVILAVAKTRLPEQPSRPQQVPGTEAERSPGTRNQRPVGEAGSSNEGRSRWPGEGAEPSLDGRGQRSGLKADVSLGDRGQQSGGEGQPPSSPTLRPRSEAGLGTVDAEPLLPASAVEPPSNPATSPGPRTSAFSVELPLRAVTAPPRGTPPYGAAPGRREVSTFDRTRGEESTPGRTRGEESTPGRTRGEESTPGRTRGEGSTPGRRREEGATPDRSRGRRSTPDGTRGQASMSDRTGGDTCMPDRPGGEVFLPDRTRRNVPGGPLAHVADGDDSDGVHGRQEEYGRQAERGAQQGPLHIALPSSAVTDVPEPVAPTVAPAVRLEERWDDYLPPSPRSMEDSGFWERPQPGAADFWAADQDGDDRGDARGDERTQAGRRHRDGWS